MAITYTWNDESPCKDALRCDPLTLLPSQMTNPAAGNEPYGRDDEREGQARSPTRIPVCSWMTKTSQTKTLTRSLCC